MLNTFNDYTLASLLVNIELITTKLEFIVFFRGCACA